MRIVTCHLTALPFVAAISYALEPKFVGRHEVDGGFLQAPDYPGEPLQPGKRVFTIRLTVDETGTPGKTDIEARDIDAPFVAAIKAVAPQWRFNPAFDPASCRTREAAAEVQVEFTDEGGKRVDCQIRRQKRA
jgi:hypothetical protein